MDKYLARWTANNSTYGKFTGNNIAKMSKEVRAITKGNTFAKNSGSWDIVPNDGEQHQYPIAYGTIKN
jgi:hypothetical protein